MFYLDGNHPALGQGNAQVTLFEWNLSCQATHYSHE